MLSLRKFVQTYRRVYQHATIFSAVVVALLFGFFLEAYMHDFNLVYITLFFVFSLAFSAGPLGILNLASLHATYLHTQRLFAHTEGSLAIQIENSATTTSWAVLLCHEETKIPLSPLKGEQNQIVMLPITPPKHGVFQHSDTYFESKYPLSTARLNLPTTAQFEGIVYPQPLGLSLRSFLHDEKNHYGEEKEFDGLRAYDGSQQLSHIHWASVAKGDMSVKIFTKETQTPKLVFDFHTIADEDEARLSQLCLWVLECEKLNLPFEIQMPNKRLKSPKESIDVILTYLANY